MRRRRLVYPGLGRRAVYTARRRVQEAAHARLARQASKTDGCVDVDLVRQARVEHAQRIVGQVGQVHDGVEAAQVGRTHVTHVARERRDVGDGFELATLEQSTV